MRVVVSLCFLAFAAVSALRPQPADAAPDGRPNILVIVGDDYGWPYYGFMLERLRARLAGFEPGSPTPECPAGGPPECQLHVSTPNLDRLAREGIAFERGYATQSNCQPAHQSLFTGLNRRDLGVVSSKMGCSPRGAHGAQTFPEALGRLGYATFVAGRFYAPHSLFNDPRSTRRREVGERRSMSVLKDFIARQSSERPWLAVWTPLTPHEQYAGIPPHIDHDYDAREPRNPPHITSVLSPRATRNYFEAITYFDERIGELVEFLELLEARSCDLGADRPATDGVATVHDPGDPRNPLTNDAANRRIRKEVACPSAPGRPCADPPSECTAPEQPSACDPDPYYDPYGRPSSGPFPIPPGRHERKCRVAQPSFPTPSRDRYAGFRTNTLIVYVMDNGAGLQRAKGQFTENGLRTPIILNYPRRIPPVGVHDPALFPHPALVGAIDVFPTVLEYAGGAPRPFPDAMSLRELAENPWATWPERWRRYFFTNSETSASGTLAVADSVPARLGDRELRLKVYASNDVLQASNVKRVTDLTLDPFEVAPTAKPPLLLAPPGAGGPAYAGGVAAVAHLQRVLHEWDDGCISPCQRCAIVSELSDVACGDERDACGCDVPVPLPCRCLGPGCAGP